MKAVELTVPCLTTSIHAELHSTGRDSGLVICLTGDSPSGIGSSTWPSITEELNHAGISVLLFDFHSQGRSSGDRSELTLEVGVRNFDCVIKVIEAQFDLNATPLGCLASSFGGSVLLNSSQHLHKFKCVSLKSPAVSLHLAYENEIGGLNQLSNWKSANVHPELGLSYEAYLSALRSDCLATLPNLSMPMLITHGDADEVVPLTDSIRLQRVVGAGASLAIFPGGMHNYKQEGAKDWFEQKNVAFFTEYLS